MILLAIGAAYTSILQHYAVLAANGSVQNKII